MWFLHHLCSKSDLKLLCKNSHNKMQLFFDFCFKWVEKPAQRGCEGSADTMQPVSRSAHGAPAVRSPSLTCSQSTNEAHSDLEFRLRP